MLEVLNFEFKHICGLRRGCRRDVFLKNHFRAPLTAQTLVATSLPVLLLYCIATLNLLPLLIFEPCIYLIGSGGVAKVSAYHF